jgi:Spy/CpxP family protein refolding chaperone
MKTTKHGGMKLALMLLTLVLATAAWAAPDERGPQGGAGVCDGSGPGGGQGPGLGIGPGGGGPMMRPDGPGGHGGGFAAKFLLRPEAKEKLGLTDEQVTKIRELDYASEKQAIELRAKAEQAELELRQLMQAETPDRDAIMKQLDKVGQAQTEMRKLQTGNRLDVQAALTAEQREKIKTVMTERRADARERRSEGRRDRPGRQGDRRGFGGQPGPAPGGDDAGLGPQEEAPVPPPPPADAPEAE